MTHQAEIHRSPSSSLMGSCADSSDIYPSGTAAPDEDSPLRPTAPPVRPSTPGKREASPYSFLGRHFVASYLGCDVALMTNHRALVAALEAAVAACGATLLKTCEYAFPEGGCTVVMLLSESHASIHTYPEVAACFVDLFTCGDACRAERFDEVLRAYLRPQEAQGRMLLRAEGVTDEPLGN